YGLVVLALNRHRKRCDLALGYVVSPVLDNAQRTVFLEDGCRLVGVLLEFFAVGCRHRGDESVDVGHDVSPRSASSAPRPNTTTCKGSSTSPFLGRSPAAASKEDVRGYQLHLSSSGARTPKINSTVSASSVPSASRPRVSMPTTTFSAGWRAFIRGQRGHQRGPAAILQGDRTRP